MPLHQQMLNIARDKAPVSKPTQHKWVTDEQGKQTKAEVAKRVKRWCTASVDGK